MDPTPVPNSTDSDPTGQQTHSGECRRAPWLQARDHTLPFQVLFSSFEQVRNVISL